MKHKGIQHIHNAINDSRTTGAMITVATSILFFLFFFLLLLLHLRISHITNTASKVPRRMAFYSQVPNQP